ncbi:hypothetical protein PPYR_15733 [Photinus pyralis]|uniref:Charged multivesicular body protein 7 n=1 Tax=Photinus pyralis TaxID=7054 RepID=A0A1Y1KAX8_PHOPY|nr:charged multivesicular body protein 7 [Photinus pyralis]KAB0789987.1 hypothetical protein PPYR_15733 [Photinus pyralis]
MSHGQVLSILPKDKLPDVWENDSRMNVLFAPFRNRAVNPHDWDSKFAFWKKLIIDTCIYNKIYTFTLEELQKLFNINGRSPACLNVIIEEMYARGELQQLEHFLQKPCKTWGSWMAETFVKKPFVWSYNKVRRVRSSSLGLLVNVPAIVSEGTTLQSVIPDDFKKRVFTLKELMDVMNLETIKESQVKLVLHHLMCIGAIDLHEIKGSDNHSVPINVLVKFKNRESEDIITEVDVNIHILEQLEKSITLLVEKLEKEVMGFVEEAKVYLAKGHRQMAKSCLRKKHEVDKRLSQKANSLHNVQLLLLKLRDSSTDAKVFESYRLALATLQKNFKDTGLSEDSVGDVVSELGSVLDMHEDIQNTLSRPLSNDDDDDLEDELALLVSSNTPPNDPSSPSKPIVDADTLELEKRLENLKLPDVPSSDTVIKNQIAL